MRHTSRILLVILLMLCLAGGASAQTLTDPGTEAEQAATTRVAERVLQQFDNAQWDASWHGVGDHLRTLVSRDDWPKVVSGLRGGLGDIQSRKPDTIGFSDDLPDVPPGRYGVLMFRSAFSNKAVREKVVLVWEDDVWKLAGYFVRHPKPGS
ncbi:MAG: DUF4019 domain-containing protein [Lysobacteraceae bacterium]